MEEKAKRSPPRLVRAVPQGDTVMIEWHEDVWPAAGPNAGRKLSHVTAVYVPRGIFTAAAHALGIVPYASPTTLLLQ
jgi:hypothetical protein